MASLWGSYDSGYNLRGNFFGLFHPFRGCGYRLRLHPSYRVAGLPVLGFQEVLWTGRGGRGDSALIMFIIGTAKIFGWGLAFYQIPEAVAKSMIGIAGNDYFWIYLMINIIVLIAGCFMETASSLINLTPIFFPLIAAVGADLIHFGVVLIIGLAIGITTPPMAIDIFVASAIQRKGP